jgi:peptidyl-prolyl cis-trans isomerase SurA
MRRVSTEVTLKLSRWAIPVLLIAGIVTVSFAQAPRPATSGPAGKPAASPDTPAKPKTAPVSRPPSAAGAAGRLDGIAAVVNDEVVLQSDVEEQLDIFLRQAGVEPDPATIDTIRHQILDQLVNEKLIVAEAKKQGITASDAEIGRQIDQAILDAKERLGGEEAYQQQLRSENTTEARLREKYRADLQRQLVAQRTVDKAIPRKSLQPTTAEAETYFKQHPDRFPKRAPEVRLSVIQIPVTPDSANDAAGKARLLEARRRIVAGEKFAKVAAEISEDPGSARAGGDLGFFTHGQMDPSVEEAAFTLKTGELSQPVHSLFGWHLIEVIERDTARTRAKTRAGADSSDAAGNPVLRDSVDATGQPVIEAHARHILIRVSTNEADAARAQALAGRVQAEAAKGTDFATLVRRYSRYQGKQAPDGDIGFVSLASLQPNIRAGLDTLELGQVSPVLQNTVGFNIFKPVDRKPERPYQLEEIREELPGAVAQLKFRERYDEWVKTLRDKAHVKIMVP